MMKSRYRIVILDYPGSFQTAVHGLTEFFNLANRVEKTKIFDVHVRRFTEFKKTKGFSVDYLILPPNLGGTFYLNPDKECLETIRKHHARKTVVCSVCAGAFILASSGIVGSETLTTHWGLGKQLRATFPELKVDTDRIVIDEGRIISAGGMMSWLDLAFQIVNRTCRASTVGQLSHFLIFSASGREQKSYKQFIPDLNHADEEIKRCQRYINQRYASHIALADLSKLAHLTSRTLIRRFIKATGHTPLDYVQSARIQKACEKLETTNQSVETIANEVGYENVGAFRKVFVEKTGLKPLDFRRLHRSAEARPAVPALKPKAKH